MWHLCVCAAARRRPSLRRGDVPTTKRENVANEHAIAFSAAYIYIYIPIIINEEKRWTERGLEEMTEREGLTIIVHDNSQNPFL